MADGVKAWSTTAATNATADANINWAEGQAPSTVNDSARAMMQAIKRWHGDFYGATTGGTSTAYTLTTNAGFDSLAEMSGNGFVVRFNATNGASPTLNVDGLGAKAIQTASGTAVATGAILANSVQYVAYDNSIPAFLLVGAFAPAFSGNVTVGGTLGVTGNFAVNTNKFTVTAASGNTLIAGTAAITGNVAIGSNTFNVTAASGNTVIGGTLGVTGAATFTTSVSAASVTGSMVAAQAGMETGTSTTTVTTPGNQHFHPGHPKAWAKFLANGTLQASYNVTSVAQDSTGDWTVTIANDFSTSHYAIAVTAFDTQNTICVVTAQAAGTFSIKCATAGGTDKDPVSIYFVCHGDI